MLRQSSGGRASSAGRSRSRILVGSTTRVMSAIVFSLMIDGSGSLDCRILGGLRPVRIVRKRGAMARQSAISARRQIDRIGWPWNGSEPLPIGVMRLGASG